MISCRGKKYEKFVDRYYDENFDEFINYEIFVRGFDNDNNPVVIVSELTSAKKQIYFVTIERKSGKIKKTNYDSLQDKTSIDTLKLNHLAANFLKYDVYQLRVDSNKEVFVTLFHEAREHLIRASTENYTNKQCEKLKGNWYMCR